MSDLETSKIDIIGKKLSQLRALLVVGSSEEFTTYNEKIQCSYLLACSDLAEEIDRIIFPDSAETKGVQL